MIKKSLLLTTLISSSVFASAFNSIGFENIGMGNVGVTNSSGSFIAYYNPALLGKKDGSSDVEFSLSGGFGYKDQNTIDNLDKLANTYELSASIDETVQHIENNDPILSEELNSNLIGIQEVLNDMATKQNYFSVTPQASFGVQWDNFSIAIYNSGDLGIKTIINPNKTDYIFNTDVGYVKYDPISKNYTASNLTEYQSSSIEYAIDNAETYLEIKGMTLTEIPLSYGQAFDTSYGKVSVGGSLKYMLGTTYLTTVKIDSEAEDAFDDFDTNKKETSTFGVDLGVNYEPFNNFNLGLVTKNLNSPKFDRVEGGSFKMDPQTRIGMSYRLLDWVDIAADYDVTKSEIYSTGEKEQYVGGGININPASWISLRAGVMKNLEAEDGMLMTAGIGFGLKWFQFDVSAQMSSESSTYDGSDIPQEARINFALVSKW